ncbi:MAG TPA: cupin domain-containing protein [Gaiellales bacterium]|jgi:mannose-6-phosphate isomerase-like protein (cupin superfamily)|nr:cupin domain-containing protein [Gaiellales bacterium]
MTETGFTRTALALDGDERFVSLRRPLEVSGMGMNLILLAPGQRGRIHDHERQEEVYLVWEGVLTLIVEGEPHDFARGELVRVGPGVRRQLVNLGPERVALVALGATPGAHVGRDGMAWETWDDSGPGQPPQGLPLPGDLPEAERRS